MRTAIALLTLLLVGCGGGVDKSALVGKWNGTVSMSLQSMQDDASGNNEQSEFLAAQEGQGKKLSLDLREDGTLTFTAQQPVEGTWALEGSTVELTLPQRTSADGGGAFSGTYRLELNGNSEMSGKDPSIEGVTVTFNK